VTRSGARCAVEHGPFTRRALARLPARNWTLLGERRRNYAAAARGLQSLFSFIPYARHDDVMVSYAAPGGGVGPHFDSYDVFLLQAAGTRAGSSARRRTWRWSKDAPPSACAVSARSAKSPPRRATCSTCRRVLPITGLPSMPA